MNWYFLYQAMIYLFYTVFGAAVFSIALTAYALKKDLGSQFLAFKIMLVLLGSLLVVFGVSCVTRSVLL